MFNMDKLRFSAADFPSSRIRLTKIDAIDTNTS